MLEPVEGFLGTERFEILRWIGEGAVGVVYEAFDHELGTKVALKVLRAVSPETLRSMKHEFRSAQDLRHPNLVRLGELFEHRGHWFFTMELVDGEGFLQYVRGGHVGPLPCDEARLRTALPQLARGLLALHEADKVHCDVKPSNTLVTHDGRVVILDFGLLREAPEFSKAWGIAGSIAYVAPELVQGEAVGPAADWYAVGVILHQALTGELPFRGATADVLDEKLHGEPPRPRTLVPAIPDDLDHLCADLLRRDPSARPGDREILRRLGAVKGDAGESPVERAAPFVGRRAELRTMDGAFDATREGHAVTVFVRGASGVGKTALVREFAQRVQARRPDTIVLSARCYERESVPYRAVDGIMDGLAETLRGLPDDERASVLPERAHLLGRAFPVLAPLCGRRPAGGEASIASPHEQRLRLYASARQLLARLARKRPLVLVIDDWQWADRDGAALVAEVLRPPGTPPLLVILAERVGTGAVPATSRSELEGEVRPIDLGPLSREDAEELALRLLGRASGAQAASIAREAGGHPLFIEELVRQRRASRAEGAALRLDEALWGRASRLDPPVRRVLELVAIAGAPITHEVAAHAAGGGLGSVLASTSALSAGRLVRTNGVGRSGTVEPYHDRVRESVVSHLPPPVQKEWHARLAVALESAAPSEPEAIAEHWQAAGEAGRAAQFALEAAGKASGALAFDLAARLYRMALEVGDFPAAERRALKAKLAEALTNAGRGAEAGDVRLDLARDADPLDALDLRRLAAEQFLCSGRFDRGVDVLRGALRECGIAYPVSPFAVVAYLLFFRFVLKLRGTRFGSPRAAVDRRTLVRIDTARSAGAGFSMTDNIRGAYFQARCLLLALAAGDAVRICRALCMEVCFSAAGGTRTRARTARLLDRAREIASGVATPEAEAMAATAAGYFHYFLGEWKPAADWLGRAEAIFRDECVGVAFELNSVRLMLYRALAFLGEIDALAGRVPPVFREIEDRGDRYSSINLRANPRALVALASDRPQDVEREVNEATQWLGSRFFVQHYFCVCALAQHDLYVGEGARAVARMQAAWPALKRSLLLRVQSIRITVLDQRARSALAAAAGDPAGRERLLRSAERDRGRLLRDGHPWATAIAQLLGAGAAHLRRDEAACIDRLRAAIAAFDVLGMALHAAVARARLAERLGGDEGLALRARADAWLAGQHVRNPGAIVATFAPGLAGDGRTS